MIDRVPPLLDRVYRLFAPDQDEIAVRVICLWYVYPKRVGKGKAVLHVTDAAVSIIGASMCSEEPEKIGTVGSPCRGQNRKGFGSVLLFLIHEFGGNEVDGFIPPDFLKLSTFFPNSLHRIL